MIDRFAPRAVLVARSAPDLLPCEASKEPQEPAKDVPTGPAVSVPAPTSRNPAPMYVNASLHAWNPCALHIPTCTCACYNVTHMSTPIVA